MPGNVRIQVGFGVTAILKICFGKRAGGIVFQANSRLSIQGSV